jgi:hypothetical protein
MAFKISRIGFKFALMLAGAAVAPLLAYGFISLMSLQRGTRDSIILGNQNVATRAAEEIRRYVSSNAELLQALASAGHGIAAGQQEQILRNYILSSANSVRSRCSTRRPALASARRRRMSAFPGFAPPIDGVDVADPNRPGHAAHHGLRHPPHA